MSKIETMEAVMPACWASALINGDYSSFSLDDDGGKEETEALEAELALYTKEGWSVSDVKRDEETGEAEEAWFTWNYAGHGGTTAGGDVLTYILIREKSSVD